MLGGIRPDELLRYLGYEAAFVVGPGWLVLRAIAPGVRSRALQLALGWPIGLTLEILAFSLTAALGFRDLFLAYPLLVGLPAAIVLSRRRKLASGKPPPSPLFTPGCRWALAGLCLLAFAYIGTAYFTITPLPDSARGVVYSGDMTFHISVAASALHDWPPADIRVVGEPFTYHYFAHLHMAAISQVTGIDLPLIVFRLYLLPLTVLLLVVAAVAGRLIVGRAWAGPLTAALLLLIREVDLTTSNIWPFGGIGMYHLWASPSQLLGMVFFVTILLVLACLLDARVAARASPYLSTSRGALWSLLVLLLIGAGGSKSVILPLLIGGLVLYLLWMRLREARIDPAALTATGLCVALFATYYLLMYQGSPLGLRLDPPGTITQMAPLERAHAAWADGWLADAAFWVVALPTGTVMYFLAPLLGLAWVLRFRDTRPPPVMVLSISLLLVGAAAFFFLYDEYLEQTYFTLFGLIAVLPLAAGGLMALVDRVRATDLNWKPLALFAMSWLAGVLLLALLADRLAARSHFLRADLVAYVPFAIAIGALGFAAVKSVGRRRALLSSYAVLGVLLTAALDSPLDVLPNTVGHLRRGASLHTESPAGLRPRELDGMDWIREHLNPGAVLAVSNDRTPDTRRFGPGDNDYPAFTEHRTFREGWVYTPKANELGQRDVAAGRKDPFPERTALELAVYRRGDPEALRTMVEKYGVTHIVISKKDGAVSPRVYRLGRLVYSNGALDVIELRPHYQ